MSDRTTYVSSGFPWLAIFICAKLAGIAGFPAWSWWWIFLPWAPVIVEVFKHFMG